jgi:two-component system chemotaxis response regulator CheB
MIRVVVVDDSGIARRAIGDALRATGDIEVVATAADSDAAIAAIRTHRPDVVTCDVEMPGMDGLGLLQHLMRSEPLPIIIISTTTQRGSQAAMRALELGAVEVLAKPSIAELPEFAGRVTRAVRAAAGARIRGRIHTPISSPTPTPTGTPVGAPTPTSTPSLAATGTPLRTQALATRPRPAERPPLPGPGTSSHPASVIAIGASTGGTEALASLLSRMPGQGPAIVIVQHLPAAFTLSFAKRLDSLSELDVSLAVDGEEILPGHAYVAPGGRHLLLRRSRERRLALGLDDGPAEHFQCPAADVLFRSVAALAGQQAIGVLLTGMGHDGASGLLAMRQAGALTIAQDEASCVVYGMPRAAVELGAAVEQLALDAIPDRLVRATSLEPAARIAPGSRPGYTGRDSRSEESR